MRVVDVLREASLSAVRAPARTLLNALGTILGVAAIVSIMGLSGTARGAVSDSFDVLRVTQVTFVDSEQDRTVGRDGRAAGSSLTLRAQESVAGLNGVVDAGLFWQFADGRPQPVRRFRTQGPADLSTPSLPLNVASARALTTNRAVVVQGRLFDAGMEDRHARVGVLGVVAARSLGVTRVDRGPVVYVRDTPITVVGVVGDVQISGTMLNALTLPTTTAEDLGLDGEREIIVRTAPGAAQTIAGQGPFAISPLAPGRVTALAPPDSSLLRNQVQSSLTSLLLALALIALAIGVVAITNVTLLAVMQRRSEIGLRRAMGAAPRHIALLVLTEAAATGTIGGFAGASLGTLTVAVVAAAKGWPPVLDPMVLVAAPLLGTLAGVLAGAYPARKATRITPIEALQR